MRVHEALSAYRADRLPVVVAVQRLETTLAPLERHLGRQPVAGIGREQIAAYVARRTAEGVQPQTARRELVTLRAALRLAWRDGRLDRVPHIPMPPPGAARQRVLTAEEIRRLRGAAAADPELAITVDLLLGTGARRKHRAVAPLPKRLIAALRRHRRRSRGDQVVALSVHQLARRFRVACRRASLEGVTPHVLRHTAATHLLRRVSLVEASRMLGHRSVAITDQVYGHLTVGDLTPGAKALNELLG